MPLNIEVFDDRVPVLTNVSMRPGEVVAQRLVSLRLHEPEEATAVDVLLGRSPRNAVFVVDNPGHS